MAFLPGDPMTLHLRADMYFCIANHRVVLLDLKADRYFCLPPPADAAFQTLAGGQPLTAAELASLEPFIRNGLLQDGPGPVPKPAPWSLVPVARGVSDARFRPGNFFPTCEALAVRVRTSARLKRHSLHMTITRLQQRKSSRVSQINPPYETIARCLSAFLTTRRFMPTHDRCLPWSIALVDYLSRYHCFPDLIIGVKMKPFAAHAWVQLGDRVLSDQVDDVLPYTPILVV